MRRTAGCGKKWETDKQVVECYIRGLNGHVSKIVCCSHVSFTRNLRNCIIIHFGGKSTIFLSILNKYKLESNETGRISQVKKRIKYKTCSMEMFLCVGTHSDILAGGRSSRRRLRFLFLWRLRSGLHILPQSALTGVAFLH